MQNQLPIICSIKKYLVQDSTYNTTALYDLKDYSAIKNNKLEYRLVGYELTGDSNKTCKISLDALRREIINKRVYITNLEDADFGQEDDDCVIIGNEFHEYGKHGNFYDKEAGAPSRSNCTLKFIVADKQNIKAFKDKLRIIGKTVYFEKTHRDKRNKSYKSIRTDTDLYIIANKKIKIHSDVCQHPAKKIFVGCDFKEIDLGNVDLSSITMSTMYLFNLCNSKITNLDLSNNLIVDTTGMFGCRRCENETYKLNTDNVVIANGMYATAIVPKHIVENWTFPNLKRAKNMFSGAWVDGTVFRNWRLPNLQDATGMFKSAHITSGILDLSNLQMPMTINAADMFSDIKAAMILLPKRYSDIIRYYNASEYQKIQWVG